MREAVILAACRTAIGKFQGSLSPFSAVELGAFVVREVVRRAGIEASQVDEIIMGNVVSAGLGQNPARQAGLKGGLSNHVAAMTINKVCGSGLKAVALAAQAIQTDNAEIVVAGGMESMTNAPYLLPQLRQGLRLGHGKGAGRDDSGRPLGRLRRLSHGHDGGTGGGKIQDLAPAPGRLRRSRAIAAPSTPSRAAGSKRRLSPSAFPQKKGEPIQFAIDESPRADYDARSAGEA